MPRSTSTRSDEVPSGWFSPGVSDSDKPTLLLRAIAGSQENSVTDIQATRRC